MAMTKPSICSLLHFPINSRTFISTSCKYRELVKPFCALLVILSVMVFNLVFRARDKTLYRFEINEIGRQFLICDAPPFFGISRMQADLKVGVNVCLLKQQLAYRKRGIRKKAQNFCTKAVLMPSIPAADFFFAFLAASSNSARVKGFSRSFFSDSDNLLSATILLFKISGPRKRSIHPLRSTGSEAGFL